MDSDFLQISNCSGMKSFSWLCGSCFFCVSFSSLVVLQLHSVGLLPPMYDKVEGVN